MNRTPPARRLAAALAGLALAGLAGCASTPPVTPLPADTPSTGPSTSPSPSPSTSATPTVTGSRPVTHDSGGCLGVVTYTVDGSDPLLPGSLCLSVGAVVRITNAFPGAEPTPASRASCAYEAGISVCRLLRAGTVVLTFGAGPTKRSIAVVVMK